MLGRGEKKKLIMWYAQARKATAQALNVGPIAPPAPPERENEEDEAPVEPLTPMMPAAPDQPALAPQDIVDGPVDLPAGVPMPVGEPIVDESRPHEGCHCEIKTLPSGKKLWRANKNACPECLAKEQAFNADQNRLFPDQA